MSEWFKEHAWKACVGETLPWVRIPLSPPALNAISINHLRDRVISLRNSVGRKAAGAFDGVSQIRVGQIGKHRESCPPKKIEDWPEARASAVALTTAIDRLPPLRNAPVFRG